MIKKQLFALIVTLSFTATYTRGQNLDTLLDKSQEILEKGRIFSTKGIGLAFPAGDISSVLRPRFSSEIGLQVLFKNPRYFIYPALDYLNYKYDQNALDPDYAYRVKNASTKFYIGTISFGVMNQIKKFRVFGSAGVGGGLVNEPRATVNTTDSEINFRSKSSFTGTFRLNAGMDYGKRTFKLFAEISYMLQSKQIESYTLHTLAINVGTKTNLYRLAKSIESIRKKR